MMKQLILEITSRCNLSCAMCLRHTWSEQTGDMDADTFRRLIPAFRRLRTLNISGYGEPTLHPRLVDMVQSARRHLPPDACIELTSNGTCIDRTLARNLVSSGLDAVSLSLDSLDETRFSTIRKGASLDQVLRAARFFSDLKAQSHRPFALNITFVAMKSTIQELPKIISYAADHGIDAVWVNNLLPPTEALAQEVLYDRFSDEVLQLFELVHAEYSRRNLDLTIFPAIQYKRLAARFVGIPETQLLSAEEIAAVGIVDDAANRALSLGGELSVTRLLERNSIMYDRYCALFDECAALAALRRVALHLPPVIPQTKRACPFVQNETAFITGDGWVRPCNQLSHDMKCYHYDREKRVQSMSFGQIQNTDVITIMECDEYRKFRETIEKFPFAPCGDCRVSDNCDMVSPVFSHDCYTYEYPCGDCLWSRGVLQCPA